MADQDRLDYSYLAAESSATHLTSGKTMRMIYGVFISLALWGCATDEHGRLISQEEVTWIEKGVTTRSQVVEKFGSPRFEVPLHSTTTTSTTSTTATAEGKSQTTTTTVRVNEPPKRTKATYPYSRSESNIPFNVKIHTSEFWLDYDENGVVRDYGFVGDLPVTATRK